MFCIRALVYATDNSGLFRVQIEDVQRLLCLFGSNAENHAQTAIEGPVHFRVAYVSFLLQPIEYFWSLPGIQFDMGLSVVGQNSRQVLAYAATGDMGQAWMSTCCASAAIAFT